jgi:hypothetical protein
MEAYIYDYVRTPRGAPDVEARSAKIELFSNFLGTYQCGRSTIDDSLRVAAGSGRRSCSTNTSRKRAFRAK